MTMKTETEPRKVTVSLPADLADALEKERDTVRSQTGYRVSMAQIAEKALRRGAGLESAQQA